MNRSIWALLRPGEFDHEWIIGGRNNPTTTGGHPRDPDGVIPQVQSFSIQSMIKHMLRTYIKQTIEENSI